MLRIVETRVVLAADDEGGKVCIVTAAVALPDGGATACVFTMLAACCTNAVLALPPGLDRTVILTVFVAARRRDPHDSCTTTTI